MCSGNSGSDYGGGSDDWGWGDFGGDSYETDDNDIDNDCFEDPAVSVGFQAKMFKKQLLQIDF